MTNSKSTKRALLSSAFAILVCVAMLIGTTFAWFTDTASTAVNKIQAGNLKVLLVDEDGKDLEGKPLEWKTADGRAQADILWEPGCTYELQPVRVKNDGNLALKYKIVITGINGSAKLNEVIDWTINDTDLESDHKLAAGAVSEPLTIKGHMQDTAGNEYMNEKIENIAITVYATQDTVENDSYGNEYDANATYPTYPLGLTKEDFDGNKVAVDNKGVFYDSFKVAMENVADNGTIYLKENSTVDFPTHLNVTKNIAIYGNGADFSGKDISIGTYVAPENNETTVNIYNTKNLIVWGQPVGTRADVWNVNFYNCTNENYNFLMYRNETGTAKINLTMTNCSASGFHDSIVHTSADGSIVIKNCTFKNNCAPVNIAHKQTGTLTVSVENSKFINCGKINPDNDYFAPTRFVNNCETGSLNVTLKNNTFTGTVGTNGDILLGDYRPGKASHKVVAKIETTDPVMVKSSEKPAYSYAGGTIVIPVVEAVSQEELNSAVKDNATGSVKLSEGTYTLPSMTNRNIVISGDKNTVIDMTTSGIIGAQNGGLDLTIEGATVKFANDNYKGVTHSKNVTYKDCTIIGKQFMYAESVEFINCKFESGNDYAVWTYGSANVAFYECEFSNTNGKAILIYREGSGTTNVTVNKCKFTASGYPLKAAIETGDNPAKNFVININVKSSTTSDNYKLWGNKNSMPAERLSVIVDDTKVY